jgi:hypothetical protein
MPIKKIKAGASKVKKVGKAVVGGTKDYSKKMKSIDKKAEKNVGKSGSRELDVRRQGKERARLKKEKGVSLKGSIKKRLKK